MGKEAGIDKLCSFAEAVKSEQKRVGDSLRLQLKEEESSFRKEDSDQLLVSRWVANDDFVPDFSTLKRWGMHSWKLRGDLLVSKLAGSVILFDFEDPNEAFRIWESGSRMFQGKKLFLERWGPEVVYWNNSMRGRGRWVRVVGLPLHFWNEEVFRKIGIVVGATLGLMKKLQGFVSYNRRGS